MTEQSLADEIKLQMDPTRKLIRYAGYDRFERLTVDVDIRILRMWIDGDDTMGIARRLTRSEAFVANRLADMRDMETKE